MALPCFDARAADYNRGETPGTNGRGRHHDELFHRMLLTAATEAYALTADEQMEVRRRYGAEGGVRCAYSMDRALRPVLGRRGPDSWRKAA